MGLSELIPMICDGDRPHSRREYTIGDMERLRAMSPDPALSVNAEVIEVMRDYMRMNWTKPGIHLALEEHECDHERMASVPYIGVDGRLHEAWYCEDCNDYID